MEKKIKHFLFIGAISVAFVCIFVFVWVFFCMSVQTQSSIVEIGEIYMSEMNVQIQQKFRAITSLRLNQVNGVITRTPPENIEYSDEMLQELKISAEVREFDYLGLYSAEGEIEIIVGDALNISSWDIFWNELEKNGNAIAAAENDAGKRFLVLAQSAQYPLRDGGVSAAIVAGVPMEYFDEMLFLSEDESLVYSHVIDPTGKCIICSGDKYGDNYFNTLNATLQERNGKTAKDYIKELSDAIAIGESYSAVVQAEGEKRHLYCTPLDCKKIDWYLVSVMPNGPLDQKVDYLDSRRLLSIFGALFVVLFAMLIYFLIYYRMSKQQMERLNRAEQEAIRANMAKSDFLSSMSHDIRTPMNAIIGMTEIALKNSKDSLRVEDCLAKVRLSSRHLLGLINDVLDMSKIESGKMVLNMDQMSLREVLGDIVNIIQPQVKERIQSFDIFIRDIVAEEVYCDEVRLNQVLLNLLSNSIKFTPEKGRIDVHVYQEASPKGEKYVRTHFIVEDTGIGMSKEFQKKIFDSFAREEENEKVQKIVGTGLGTSITKSIVTLMGGTIEVKSEQGKGSRFHVTIDLQKAFVGEDEMSLPAWNVLVVDDNELLCISAAANLEELGVHAEWVQDGMKAVEMIEARHKKNEDYQFVLIDWKMPGMDGIGTIREIYNRVGKGIPIFLISAYDWSDIEEDGFGVEIEGFISKPLFKSTLYTRLRQYVDGDESAVETEEAIDFSGKHILLAEDIDINWEIANEILSSVGLVLERAVNGQDCVEKFKASAPGFYDAILMDIRMPIMNGYDATKTIRALEERPDQGLPIIAMTADAFSDDAQRCFECGMDAHLAKPLDIKEVMRTLQQHLK